MGEHLFSKYTRFVVDYTEGNEGRQTYPLWWLQSPEVGFSSWTPDGPYHGRACKAGELCATCGATSDVQASPATISLPAASAKPDIAQAADLSAQGLQSSLPSFALFIAAVGLSASMSAVAYFIGRRHGCKEVTHRSQGYNFLPA